jgi:hypothetical protein
VGPQIIIEDVQLKIQRVLKDIARCFFIKNMPQIFHDAMFMLHYTARLTEQPFRVRQRGDSTQIFIPGDQRDSLILRDHESNRAFLIVDKLGG